MPSNMRRYPIRADGATTLANGGQLSIRLDQLQPLAGIPNGTTYLRSLELEFNLTAVGNDSATVGEDHVFDFLQSIVLSIPGIDRQVLNLTQYAGSRMRYAQWAITGKRAQACNGGAGGTLTPASSAGTALRARVEIRFYNQPGVRESDWGIPINFLREAASIEIQYAGNLAAGGYAGANIAITGTLARQSVELYERPDFEFPQFYSLELMQLGALTGELPISARVLSHVIEVAAQTDANGQATIALADRTLVNLTVYGRMVEERMDVRTLVAMWNNYVPLARAEELPDPNNTPSWLPWHFPMASTGNVKATQNPLAIGRPVYNVTGSDTSPTLIVLATDLNDEEKVAQRADRVGLRVAPGREADWARNQGAFLSAKSASKQSVTRGSDGAARLPLRYFPKGRPTGGPAARVG